MVAAVMEAVVVGSAAELASCVRDVVERKKNGVREEAARMWSSSVAAILSSVEFRISSRP